LIARAQSIAKTETASPQNCIKCEVVQARTPCAKNGCGIIRRYCYAPEISGCYCPVSLKEKDELCSQLAGSVRAHNGDKNRYEEKKQGKLSGSFTAFAQQTMQINMQMITLQQRH